MSTRTLFTVCVAQPEDQDGIASMVFPPMVCRLYHQLMFELGSIECQKHILSHSSFDASFSEKCD